MNEDEMKDKYTERAKIFQQAMESCKSSSPIDCIEWFADRILELEKELEFEQSVNGEFTAIEKLRKLEVENTNLKDVIEGYKKIAKWCDKCDKIAELKSENQKWKDEWQEQVQEATEEGYARTLQTIQLTKAKEIIKTFLGFAEAFGYSPSMDKFITEAEQFISEVEK